MNAPPFNQAATAYFYSPQLNGAVDLTQGAISTPVLPGTPEVRVVCMLFGLSDLLGDSSDRPCTFDLIDPSSTPADSFNGLRRLLQIVGTDGASRQWYSPHARSVLARYIQWALWDEQISKPNTVSSFKLPLGFVDIIQSLNTPAFMALQERLSWSPARVVQLFPSMLPRSAGSCLGWPMVDPLVAGATWHNLSKFLHTHSPCLNLVT